MSSTALLSPQMGPYQQKTLFKPSEFIFSSFFRARDTNMLGGSVSLHRSVVWQYFNEPLHFNLSPLVIFPCGKIITSPGTICPFYSLMAVK